MNAHEMDYLKVDSIQWDDFDGNTVKVYIDGTIALFQDEYTYETSVTREELIGHLENTLKMLRNPSNIPSTALAIKVYTYRMFGETRKLEGTLFSRTSGDSHYWQSVEPFDKHGIRRTIKSEEILSFEVIS